MNFSNLPNIKSLENYVKDSLQGSLIKEKYNVEILNFNDIVCNSEIYNKNIMSCLCQSYFLFLSIINPNVNFEDITNLINNIEFEIPLFILLLFQL